MSRPPTPREPEREANRPPVLQELAEATPPIVCRKLRTKMAFLPLRNAEGQPLYWQRGDSGTEVYWCLRTMECAGPDGCLAHASLCRGDRLCYEPLTS